MYCGTFINLDRDARRRLNMERQLAACNIADKYTRFAAIDGASLAPRRGRITRSELACIQSHYGALEQAKAHGTYVHVLEDDAVLSQYVPYIIEKIQMNRSLDHYDIIFTDTLIPLSVAELNYCKRLFERLCPGSTPASFATFDISAVYTSCTSSYVIGPHAVERVLVAYRQALKTAAMPLDFAIRQQARAGRLKLGCVFPFVTTVTIGDDSGAISDRAIDGIDRDRLMQRAANLVRYSFFINRDLEKIATPILKAIREAKAKRSPDQHHELISSILDFAISNDFVPF
jgi:GR25 family glycosyltransferase involved in LPS biosynthesis